MLRVVLSALAGGLTCVTVLVLFLGEVQGTTAARVLFLSFGTAIILTMASLAAYVAEMLLTAPRRASNGGQRGWDGRCALGPARSPLRLRDILSDAPKHPAGVDQGEIAHFPITITRVAYGNPILLGNLSRLNPGPPGVHILHQQVHLQVLGKFLDVIVLQQGLRVRRERHGVRNAAEQGRRCSNTE